MSPDLFIATYVGRDACGFVNGKEYTIELRESEYGWRILSYDVEKDKEIVLPISSMNSFYRFWEKISEVVE